MRARAPANISSPGADRGLRSAAGGAGDSHTVPGLPGGDAELSAGSGKMSIANIRRRRSALPAAPPP
eukprot:CAMPEP_0175368008 /NCGR_PEP_ID=MMETSP0095-20121207/19957_1 /TAXON_ID=311494 /ORGANISM="Alexandrium monilatum, Strain CCMP3105" /LENGTH=66 /DNA_ID=CAMNT_0016666085 /DNA_START=75 /DNA_END=271 /DNA_ORIENTATION=-